MIRSATRGKERKSVGNKGGESDQKSAVGGERGGYLTRRGNGFFKKITLPKRDIRVDKTWGGNFHIYPGKGDFRRCHKKGSRGGTV